MDVNPTCGELKEWYSKSGFPLKKFFNTSGLLYKEMKLKDKLPAMSEEEQLQLLATNGSALRKQNGLKSWDDWRKIGSQMNG